MSWVCSGGPLITPTGRTFNYILGNIGRKHNVHERRAAYLGDGVFVGEPGEEVGDALAKLLVSHEALQHPQNGGALPTHTQTALGVRSGRNASARVTEEAVSELCFEQRSRPDREGVI